jgi:hypothetical protein
MSDPRYVALAFGLFSLFLAILYSYLGKAWNRSNAWIYRTKEPTQYWLLVGTYYLSGIAFVAYYLYKVLAFSN